MTRDAFDIAYACHTASCTFLLDEAGICRRVVMSSTKRPNEQRSLARCMGAQYVASLDARTPGGLVELPRVGASMLFARTDERGRISLVRTGIVTKFESRVPPKSKKTHDPFEQTDGVRTSAPDVSMTTTPRGTRIPKPAAGITGDEPTSTTLPDEGPPAHDPLYFDTSDRTQRMPAVRGSRPDAKELDEESFEVDVDDLATAEYPSAPPPPPRGDAIPRSTLPSTLAPPALPTLRRPHVEPHPPSSDEVQAARPRTFGRRSERALRAAAASSAAATARMAGSADLPDAPRSDLQVATRRRS